MKQMKQLLLGGVAAVALSTAVGAVELTPAPESLPPAEASPYYNWMGAYARTNRLAPASEPLLQGAPTPTAADSLCGASSSASITKMAGLYLALKARRGARASISLAPMG